MAIERKGKILTPREQKQAVLKWTGWTTAQYNKEYDKLRNKVRNYERINGYARGSINAADLLAVQARNQHYAPRYNLTPQPTQLYMAVQATTSAGTNTELSKRAISISQTAARAAITGRYHGLLEKSPLVIEAVENLKKTNPNYTAEELERTIINTVRVRDALKQSQQLYRKTQLQKGIIIDISDFIDS